MQRPNRNGHSGIESPNSLLASLRLESLRIKETFNNEEELKDD